MQKLDHCPLCFSDDITYLGENDPSGEEYKCHSCYEYFTYDLYREDQC